jgi:hypothetical protein
MLLPADPGSSPQRGGPQPDPDRGGQSRAQPDVRPSLPDYAALNANYGVRFEAQEMNEIHPVPAGLFGPIRLLATPGGR